MCGFASSASRYSGNVSQSQVRPSASAVPGMSSTPFEQADQPVVAVGRAGAKPTPQLPIAIVVTPWIDDGATIGSQVTWPSKWVWMSTKPGRDEQPVGVDLAGAACSSTSPTAVIVDAGDRDVAPERRCPGAVDDRAVADDEISHAHNAATRPCRRASQSAGRTRGTDDDVPGDPVGDGARRPGGDQGRARAPRPRAGRGVGAQPRQGRADVGELCGLDPLGVTATGRPRRDLRDRRRLRRLRAGAREHHARSRGCSSRGRTS